MVFAFIHGFNKAISKATNNGRKNKRAVLILSVAAALCVSCGVRGPLTVYPKKIGGNLASPEPLKQDSAVLYGAKGERIALPAPLDSTGAPATPN